MTDLIRWEPMRELMSLREAMDRLFEESFISPRAWWTSVTEIGPAFDMYETPEEVVVKATVPGLKGEDIDVSIAGNTLTIRGEFKEETKDERASYIRQERRYGAFCRSVSLPTPVNSEKAEAVLENGVLTLRLPKAEEVKPKAIKVKRK
jgi:HSP20 family protein